jgi:hypothetical protein
MPKTKLLVVLAGLVAMASWLMADITSTIRQVPTTYGKSVGLTSSVTPQAPTSSSTSTPTSPNGNVTDASAISDTTENWAGYVSTGGAYTTVSGSWTVPSVVAGTDPVAADATWIGIGGDTSSDLIQVGTQNVVEDGQVTPGSFYEQLPNTSQTVPNLSVSAGDTITASIKEVATGEWSISIEDITNGESYTNTVAYSSSESSAEWIEEAPSDGNTIVPLDQFGSVTFTGGSTTENGDTVSIAGSNAQSLTMDDEEGQALATTSALSSSGDSFIVTRTDVSGDSTVGDGQYSNIPGGWTRHEPGLSGYGGWGRGHRSWSQGYTSSNGYTQEW